MTSTDQHSAKAALQSIPGIPREGGQPVFSDPWQAQAFAITLALQERGLFTWGEWSAALGEEIKRAQANGDPDTGETYYHHWLVTLERLIGEKGIASRDTLTRYHDAWDRAADRTPHGTPIELRPQDFEPHPGPHLGSQPGHPVAGRPEPESDRPGRDRPAADRLLE